jgi:type II secretory pathway pseudopilin PulG
MKTRRTKLFDLRTAAFTLVEVLVGVMLLGGVVTALYAGMTYGLARTAITREEMRATQVMLEKMEQLRLYTWEQLNYNYDPDDPEDATDPFDPEDPHDVADEPDAFLIPATFSEPFTPGLTNSGSLQYFGTFSITNLPISEAYSNSLRLVTVSVTWTNGNKARTRSMQTLFARYGMQNNIQ